MICLLLVQVQSNSYVSNIGTHTTIKFSLRVMIQRILWVGCKFWFWKYVWKFKHTDYVFASQIRLLDPDFSSLWLWFSFQIVGGERCTGIVFLQVGPPTYQSLFHPSFCGLWVSHEMPLRPTLLPWFLVTAPTQRFSGMAIKNLTPRTCMYYS